MILLFYIASAVAVLSTLMVITRLNAAHALLYLIVSFFAISVVFYLLGAPFIAALEVIIYAGAIMVLFVFVIMILNITPRQMKQESRFLRAEIWIGPAVLTLVLLAELLYIIGVSRQDFYTAVYVGPKQVGIALLGPYVLGVELASFLLLAGLVGAYHLGRRESIPHEEAGGS